MNIAMMSVNDPADLLFFDTFSHDTSEELNLDLVQFPKSVFVREIRIIPLGARVQGDFPGGVRLGATNPTQFHIDFFVNDLGKPGASTFESLGSLDYSQNGHIHMECINSVEQPRIPTDGLVLKGWYTTITLAVYGNLTQLITDVTGTNQPQGARPAIPRDVVPVQTTVVQNPDWNPEPPAPIPTYTGNIATSNTEVYGAGTYPPESYDTHIYRNDYYDNDGPKDPRTYQIEDNDWEKERRDLSCEREPERLRVSPRLDHDRDRDRREGRSRRRSLDRRSQDSSRNRDCSRDLERRSVSRERDYIVKGEYRPYSRSRSRSVDRKRGISVEHDWDRGSYKKDEFRRHRDNSYDRSRAGSYEKRSGSYERRGSPYSKRGPSYERKTSYEKRSPYDKRASSYERRAPSYDKHAPYEKKRHSPYNRIRDSSYGSRSPSRDDPRKKPRTPPDSRRPISPRERETGSLVHSIRSEEAVIDYERSEKPIPRVDFYQSYRHKSSIRSPSQELENPSYIEPQHSSLVTVPIVDTTTPKLAVIEPANEIAEEERSLDEPFEPILSDEDICDDLEGPYMDIDYDVNEYCGVDDIIKYYNPFKSEWVKYENKNKIHLLATVKGEGIKDVLNSSFKDLSAGYPDLMKIYELANVDNAEQKFQESSFTDIDTILREDWVHQCEQLFLLVQSLCKETDIILRIFNNSGENDSPEFLNVFKYLLTFLKIGLNFNFALAQKVTYKIRHMKCGIRLAEALVSHKHNGIVVSKLLQSGINIPLLLLEFYSKEYMALSIRLMIIKALNGCLSSKISVEHFMHDAMLPRFEKSEDENKLRNGYQALISIMKTNPLARIKFSISALIKKLNMYEVLGKLHEIIFNFNRLVAENTLPEDAELSEKDIEFIANSLDEIIYMYRSQCFHISQPKRFLPVSAQFEINKECSNEILHEFFNVHNFLETCLYLLTCPATCNNLVIISPVHDMIFELVQNLNGIKYLYDNMNTTELLFRTLMQPYGQQTTEECIFSHDVSNYTDLQVIGLEMAYKLKSMYYLESIRDIQAGKPDENELIDRLQELFCLSFGNIGKTAVCDVISMGDNPECLIEVFEKDSKYKCKSEPTMKQKSPAKGYAIDLIVSAVKYSSDVTFLKKYGNRILNVVKESEKFEPSVANLLQELVPYLKPLENINVINGEDMAECVETLKNSLKVAIAVPGELLTCLRILRHYCISDYDRNISIACESATEEYVELKYKYNLLQLFSLDGVSHISAILERLLIHFEQPSMHSSYFASLKGLHIAQIILPCLRLLDGMLARIVKSRGSKFRDVTAAPILLKTYGLVTSFPPGSVANRTATKAAEAAVRALLAYAQPAADDANDGDSIRRGPWTSLCSEVINYTMTAPYTFVPGLLLFSELLPLPLPMQTKIPPTEREISDAFNERRLWSAHLHALGNDLTDMIQVICMSSYRPVVHLLRRVCVQIADLAPNTATMVARAAVGAVIRELVSGQPASASAARVLGFLACLVAHAPVKCAVLYCIASGGPKSDEVQTALCGVLSLSHSSTEHTLAQEYAAHAIAGLCDAEVTLTPLSGNTEQLIANLFMSKDKLSTILEASADCLATTTKTCAVASSILRAYFVLTDHEYGFQQFQKLINTKKEAFGKFFKWLVDGCGEDTTECLSLFLDLLRILRVEEGEGPIGRKSFLSLTELADVVGYTQHQSDHCALSLEKLLKEKNCEEDAISNASLLASSLVREADTPPPPAASPPPPAPPPQPLVAQFLARSLHATGDATDERLTSGYWLNIPEATADEDIHEEMVSCDIAEIARSELSSTGGLAGLSSTLRCLAGLQPTDLVPTGHILPALSVGGRVLSAAGGAACATTCALGDTFRSRPPNTSRPPSLHVDDFTAMERAPTSYGKPPVTRGLRRGMGGPERGRFPSAVPHHAHYRHMRGRGAWEMGSQHFGHFPPSQYMMGGMGWGGARMQRGRHRPFMR